MNELLKNLLGFAGVPGDGCVVKADNYVSFPSAGECGNQQQTAEAFSSKWELFDYEHPDFRKALAGQKAWYLDLYGFADEEEFAEYLGRCDLVLDAGAGVAAKSAWFAELSPSTTVVAADISRSLDQASSHFRELDNLVFVQCDIGGMPFFRDGLFDYVSCDQVIHHTRNPHGTFRELVRVTDEGGEVSTYVYRKKALPRELLDDYFREHSKTMDHESLMEFSKQLAELGRLLDSVKGTLDFPDIPTLGIEGGKMTVQRFVYWNFLKCFWNEDLGGFNSTMTNYDWYSPSQASRLSEAEFKGWIDEAALEILHFNIEKACYSGRFGKRSAGASKRSE